MAQELKSVAWNALEHQHVEKKSDWFWIAGIIIIASAIASILLGNTLLGVLIFVAGAVIIILAARPPQVLSYEITQRGLRIDDTLYPYTTLEAYYIDEENPLGPQLLVKSQKMFMPLFVIPLPEEYIDDIEGIILERLPEEHIEEPLAHKLLEFFGF